MVDRWGFARRAFDEHFEPLRARGYTLERLADAAAYWKLHEAELRSHFPEEFFFDLSALRSPEEVAGQERLAQARGGAALEDFTVVRRGAQIVAMFSGQQLSEGLYRMWHTNVRREHRRQGIYAQILASTLAYTRALGFDAVTSEHAPCNNPILIAKLRAGFCVYGLTLDAGPGPSLVLRYFHNPEHLAAYRLRCGVASLTPALAAHATGAWPALMRQVASATPTR